MRSLNDDAGAERAQGTGAVVVVVRHRSYGPAALTQQRRNLGAHAADSAAGTSHQDETRLSYRPPPLVFVKSFRMAKSDLQAHQTGWSIRNFIKTARRYRTIHIEAGDHV